MVFLHTDLRGFLQHVTGSSTPVNNYIYVNFVTGDFYTCTCTRAIDISVSIDTYEEFEGMLCAALSCAHNDFTIT